MKTAQLLICIAAAALGSTAAPGALRAQPASDSAIVNTDDKPWSHGVSLAEREAGIALFLEGNRLFSIPVFSRAAEQYTSALGHWKHPAIYFNLALAQLNLGQQVEARANFELALKYGEPPLGADRFHEAQKQLAQLEHDLGRIHISCPTRGAEVTLDGRPLFSGPDSYDGWVAAKPHEITAKKAGYLAEARRVVISAGDRKSVDLKLITLSEAADAGRRWAGWKPWVVVSGGLAVLAGGAVLHALSSRKFDQYDNSFAALPCAKATGCEANEVPASLKSTLTRARHEQTLAITGYAVGGSLAAAGLILVYMNRPRLSEQPVASGSHDGLAIAPVISPEMTGISISAIFE